MALDFISNGRVIRRSPAILIRSTLIERGWLVWGWFKCPANLTRITVWTLLIFQTCQLNDYRKKQIVFLKFLSLHKLPLSSPIVLNRTRELTTTLGSSILSKLSSWGLQEGLLKPMSTINSCQGQILIVIPNCVRFWTWPRTSAASCLDGYFETIYLKKQTSSPPERNLVISMVRSGL